MLELFRDNNVVDSEHGSRDGIVDFVGLPCRRVRVRVFKGRVVLAEYVHHHVVRVLPCHCVREDPFHKVHALKYVHGRQPRLFHALLQHRNARSVLQPPASVEKSGLKALRKKHRRLLPVVEEVVREGGQACSVAKLFAEKAPFDAFLKTQLFDWTKVAELPVAVGRNKVVAKAWPVPVHLFVDHSRNFWLCLFGQCPTSKRWKRRAVHLLPRAKGNVRQRALNLADQPKQRPDQLSEGSHHAQDDA